MATWLVGLRRFVGSGGRGFLVGRLPLLSSFWPFPFFFFFFSLSFSDVYFVGLVLLVSFGYKCRYKQTDTDTDRQRLVRITEYIYTYITYPIYDQTYLYSLGSCVYIYTPVECIKNVTTCRYFMQPNNANLVLCGIMQQWMNQKKKKKDF